MRTNIVIDDDLMAEMLKRSGAKTKKEAVELGMRTFIDLKKQEGVRKYRGKLKWEGSLEEMRKSR
jgi:Arc/MetJ family transcription regulator